MHARIVECESIVIQRVSVLGYIERTTESWIIFATLASFQRWKSLVTKWK